jgi:hypothetical protein
MEAGRPEIEADTRTRTFVSAHIRRRPAGSHQISPARTAQATAWARFRVPGSGAAA